jgi:hypothetical protein
MVGCPWCGTDLRRLECVGAGPDAIVLQSFLERVLKTGSAPVGRYGRIHSILFFVVLHQLMKMLVSRRSSRWLLTAVRSRFGIDVRLAPEDLGREVGALGPETRHDLLRAAAGLLDRWPDTLVEICKRTRTWQSTVLRDLEDAPFALWDPVRQHLDRTFYVPNAAEVEAVRNYCISRGINPTGHRIRRLTGIDSRRFFA